MKNETVKEKFVNFVSKMGKKNLVVIASVTVIAVALIVGITVFNESTCGASGNIRTTAFRTNGCFQGNCS